MISQSTGEDWVDTRLVLSTAQPSIGGSPPELGTRRLYFPSFRLECNLPQMLIPQQLQGMQPQAMQLRACGLALGQDDDDDRWSDSDTASHIVASGFAGGAPPPPALGVSQAEVSTCVSKS